MFFDNFSESNVNRALVFAHLVCALILELNVPGCLLLDQTPFSQLCARFQMFPSWNSGSGKESHEACRLMCCNGFFGGLITTHNALLHVVVAVMLTWFCLNCVSLQDFMMQQTMLRVKDPVKSLDFYTRILGMTWVFETGLAVLLQLHESKSWRVFFFIPTDCCKSSTSRPCASLSSSWATRTRRRFPQT